MPTELEELVEFIHHGNTPIRQLAVENLIPYSLSQPSIFKSDQLLPVRDLKLLVKDYEAIAKDAITILINLSNDREVLENLATDDKFIETLLARINNMLEPNADSLCMLLANISKHPHSTRILETTRPPPAGLGSSDRAISQLVDLFVRGADRSHNKSANYDYLSYVFADLVNHAAGRRYFLEAQAYDGVIPLAKLVVFTEHGSAIRRRGVASTLKNVAFEVDDHPAFLSSDGIHVLPYVLLPLMGGEEYSDEDTEGMLEEVQLLGSDKRRESDVEIMKTHVETLMIFTTEREGREVLREKKVYPIVRELHLAVDDEELREVCDRLVQVLMRDEEGLKEGREEALVLAGSSNGGIASSVGHKIDDAETEDSDDDKIVEV